MSGALLFKAEHNSPHTYPRSHSFFTEAQYTLKTSPTEDITVKGVYSIVDGGFHRWVATMSASRLVTGEDFARCVFNVRLNFCASV